MVAEEGPKEFELANENTNKKQKAHSFGILDVPAERAGQEQ